MSGVILLLMLKRCLILNINGDYIDKERFMRREKGNWKYLTISIRRDRDLSKEGGDAKESAEDKDYAEMAGMMMGKIRGNS